MQAVGDTWFFLGFNQPHGIRKCVVYRGVGDLT